MLVINVTSALRGALERVFDEAQIVRMRSLQYQLWRWFRSGGIPVNPRRLVGPKYPFRAFFHSDEARATEPLRVGQIRLASPKFDFDSLAFLDIEVDSDPVEDRSVLRSKGLRAAEEPAVAAFSVTSPKTHFARAAGSQALRPDPPGLLMILWMEKGDMRVPCWRGVCSIPKRMIAREPTEVRISLVDEDEPARRRRVPRVRRDHVQRGSQLFFKRLIHTVDLFPRSVHDFATG